MYIANLITNKKIKRALKINKKEKELVQYSHYLK